MGHFPQKWPIFSGSFSGRHLVALDSVLSSVWLRHVLRVCVEGLQHWIPELTSHIWWVKSHVWMTHSWVMSHAWMTHPWVMSHAWMSRSWVIHESYHTHEGVEFHVCVCRVSRSGVQSQSHTYNESCHTYDSINFRLCVCRACSIRFFSANHTQWVMSHVWMSHVPPVCVQGSLHWIRELALLAKLRVLRCW